MTAMESRDVIMAFVAHLRGNGYPGLQVDRWPDEENRKSVDIDTIAGPFAIEHTSVDTVPHQRRDSDWFAQVVGPLREGFPGISFRLRITVEYEAVTKGQNWSEIRNALKEWIANESLRLADGSFTFNGVAGIPFPFRVKKLSDRPPGVFIARDEPLDDTLPLRIRDQFDRKAKKLAEYKKEGKVTVLLIESADMALMNEGKMLDAIRSAYPSGILDGVDKLWFADTSIPGDIVFTDFTIGRARGQTRLVDFLS